MSEMTHPTDDELEAMARILSFVANRTGLTVEKCEEVTDKAAAMLRACKAGDAPSYLDGWNDAREAAAKVADKMAARRFTKDMCEILQKCAAAIRALTPPERPKP
jgi:hypothetical protein